MHPPQKRLKVLLSAYACEPNRGSEPGVGWRWAAGLAGRVDLTVVTRANNRSVIEQQLARLDPDHPLHGVDFVYHDLPEFCLLMKRIRVLGTMPYYFLWQWTVARRLRNQVRAVDIVHHLTFCTPLCPGFWPDGGFARVIGPVGAPLVNSHYLPLFGYGRHVQAARGWLMRHLNRLPWLRRAFFNAAAVIPASSEAKELLESMGVRCQPVILDTGAPDHPSLTERPVKPPGHCRFLYAGVLERRKGLELALRAFAYFIQNSTSNIQNFSTLTILGSGPDSERLESIAHELGIAGQVHFPGSVPQAEVFRYFANSDVFVFTSVRDTSGGVNLEAMAAGLPILCIAHQGVGDITDDACAIRVPAGPIPDTIDALAEGMRLLTGIPELRRRLGENARRRALEKFSWDEKFERMLEIYESVEKRGLSGHTFAA